ncbi:MAG: SCP2 sterol-binding domain-containing protein [Planctomycetes bacterium]|nr:SCP2 sterol-binding domain-containing protein [Planctomycetota bacterium]
MALRNEHLEVDPADRNWLARAGLGSVRAVLKLRPNSVAAISGSSETFSRSLEEIEGAPPAVFIKRYRYRGWRARLAGMFRGTLFGASRARFEFAFLQAMRARGIRAVRPIAYAEQRRWGFLRACVLITEAEGNAIPLDRFAVRYATDESFSRQDRRRFTETLAETVRKMHEAGVMHGGLFGRNILVRNGTAGRWELILLDPDRRGRLYGRAVPRNGVISDLADLAATLAPFQHRNDVVRFTQAYRGRRRLDAGDKALIRAVAKTSEPRIRQEAHRVAIGGAIDWLHNYMASASQDKAPPIRSIDAFFETIARRAKEGVVRNARSGCAQFRFDASPDRASAKPYTVTFHDVGLEVRAGLIGKPDLAIETDADAWLCIVNGEKEAFDAIRGGRLRMTGDTTLLEPLTQLLGRPNSDEASTGRH